MVTITPVHDETTRTPGEADPTADPPASRRTRRWNALMVAVPTVVIAFAAWWQRALTDDGLIFLRTVRQILAGNGPVVNVDERIETNTSALWQWILVGLGAVVPGDLGRTAVYAGLVATTAGVALALDATRRLYGAGGVALVPVGVLVLFGVPPMWEFATAGLDSGLGTLWIAGCWWLLVRTRSGPSGRERIAHAVWFGLGVLVRPDLALVTACFVAGAWLALRPSVRGACAQMGAGMLVPVAYEVFRAGYYGLLVPLPALTKEADESEVGRGLRYVGDFVGPYWLYVPLLVVAGVFALCVAGAPGDRRRWIVPATPVVAAVLSTAYVVRLGGDYMHGRMLLAPLFLLLLPVLLVPATRITAVAGAAVVTWAIACVGPWHPAAFDKPDISLTVSVRQGDITITGVRNPDSARAWRAAFPEFQAAIEAGLAAGRPVLVRLRPDGGPDVLLPLHPQYDDTRISVPGGYLGVTGELVPLEERIVEVWSLANTVGAHMEYPQGWRDTWPGHRKLVEDVWLLATELDPAVVEPPAGVVNVTRESLAAARRALSCGDLAELVASTRDPLTVDRFMANLTGAYERTSLRIPRDPFAAERKFCGV